MEAWNQRRTHRAAEKERFTTQRKKTPVEELKGFQEQRERFQMQPKVEEDRRDHTRHLGGAGGQQRPVSHRSQPPVTLVIEGGTDILTSLEKR